MKAVKELIKSNVLVLWHKDQFKVHIKRLLRKIETLSKGSLLYSAQTHAHTNNIRSGNCSGSGINTLPRRGNHIHSNNVVGMQSAAVVVYSERKTPFL